MSHVTRAVPLPCPELSPVPALFLAGSVSQMTGCVTWAIFLKQNLLKLVTVKCWSPEMSVSASKALTHTGSWGGLHWAHGVGYNAASRPSVTCGRAVEPGEPLAPSDGADSWQHCPGKRAGSSVLFPGRGQELLALPIISRFCTPHLIFSEWSWLSLLVGCWLRSALSSNA